MPLRVKRYIASVIASAALVLAAAFGAWNFSDPAQFALLLAMALFSATLKIRLPGLDGTYSLLFVFVLASATLFSPLETSLIAGAGVLVQCLVVCEKRPTLIQILFNMSQAIVAARVAHWVRSGLERAGHGGNTFEVVLCTGMTYFAVNTIVVSAVIAMLSDSNIVKVWKQWHLVCFPYHLLATVICAAVIAGRTVVQVSDVALTVPVLTMMYLFFTFRIRKRLRPFRSAGTQTRQSEP